MALCKLLIVYNEYGRTAAYRLEELILENETYLRFFGRDMQCPGIVKWNENYWLANHITKDGEACNYTIFIGDINDTKEMRETSRLLFENEQWGVSYRKEFNNVLISANRKKLVHNKEEYEKFLNELYILSPNEIKKAVHGIKKVGRFGLSGLKGIFQNRDNIEKQQLLYAVNIFSKQYLKDYIAKIMHNEEVINSNSDEDL